MPPGLGRKLAPGLLLIAVLAIGYLLKGAPRDHEITLRLEGAREALTRLDVRLLGPDSEEEAGARWAFAPGQAPATLRLNARVAPGRWRVRVSLEARGEPQQIDRAITLEGEPVRIPLRIE